MSMKFGTVDGSKQLSLSFKCFIIEGTTEKQLKHYSLSSTCLN